MTEDETTREQIADFLRETPAAPSTLAVEFDITPGSALRHAKHIARSVESGDEQLLVAPPECRDCGFDRFDDPANRPSRCPECKSEAIDEPTFTIRNVE
ncbi:transcriptional regulator [Haladaptatus cibarius]|uniref:transcriptional regulator n=1 Tax=Haladaptatus cibarius TaxID=453847 RepID=UPI000679DDE1|nr:transcriptional regulator [Haladaptatus cibarius]